MQRQLLLACGCILLLGGWLSAFLLNSMPHALDIYLLVPTLCLAIGMGIVRKLLGWGRTALVLALTAFAAIFTFNQIQPGKPVTFNFFHQRLQQQSIGQALTLEVQPVAKQGVFAEDRQLEAIADLKVNLFARLPGPARMLQFDPSGNLFVSIPKLGAVYLVRDRDGNGYAEQPLLYHAGMDRPHGLAWHQGKLFVAEPARLLELEDLDGDGQADQQRVIIEGLPDDGGHWTRSLALGADGNLYLSVGSRCNACEEADERRAAVLKVDPQSGKAEVFARGLRNTVGLAFAPDGETLWGSDNGRDMLGDDLPPDEINRIVAGGDYGWPFCFGERIADPELGSAERCTLTQPATVELPAHSAPLGIAFGTGLKAPERYQNSLYVAFHGSWNRSVPTGYKLIRIPFADGSPSGSPKEFLSGWLTNGTAWGRPVAPAVGPDGALYLSDDHAAAIYRILWNPQE